MKNQAYAIKINDRYFVANLRKLVTAHCLAGAKLFSDYSEAILVSEKFENSIVIRLVDLTA